jgi:mRNA interferase RelE/StbE
MSYKLEFVPAAKKEWDKLGHTIKQQFKKKLAERLEHPHVPKDAISGGSNLYKIKLKSAGYRLVYEVDDMRVIVLVLAIGKRNRDEVYKKLFARVE